MHRRALLAAGAAAATFGAAARFTPARAEEPVDVLLVLAVDVSRSVDEDEARLQRDGYRNAVSDPLVVEAIRGGMIGAIGVAYVEWAGAEYQRLVLPWTRIAGPADAFTWASRLDEAPRASLSWTSGRLAKSAMLHATKVVMVSRPPDSMVRLMDVNSSWLSLASRSRMTWAWMQGWWTPLAMRSSRSRFSWVR